MRIILIWLALESFLLGQEGLSIEAFWLGSERFREEVAPGFDSEMPERKAATIAPVETRFIKEGDVLWDVREHYQEQGFELENGWIAYNETTGYLVAKAQLPDLLALEFRHKVDSSSAVKNLDFDLEVYEVNDSRSEWISWAAEWAAVEKRSLFAMTMRGRSSETITQRFRDEEGREVSVELQPTLLWWWDNVQDSRIALTIKSPQLSYSLNTKFAIPADRFLFLELGSIQQGKTLVARLRPETLLVGGPSLAEWHLFEDVTKKNPLPEVPMYGSKKLHKEGGFELVYWRVGQSFPSDIVDEPVQEVDPFSPDSGVGEKPPKKWEGAVPPPIVQKFFPREQWEDCSELLEKCGVSFGEGEFAYFGRLNGVLAVRGRKSATLDLIAQIVEPLHSRLPADLQTHLSLIREENGRRELIAKTNLPSRSGETASVNWEWKSGSWELEVQPTIGGSERVVDIRLFSKHGVESTTEVNTALSYQVGIPQEFLLKKVGKESVFLRVEVVRADFSGNAIES